MIFFSFKLFVAVLERTKKKKKKRESITTIHPKSDKRSPTRRKSRLKISGLWIIERISFLWDLTGDIHMVLILTFDEH